MYPAPPVYSERHMKVFFGNILIPEATFVGFKDLGEGWAKDIRHVFYMGQIVPDANSFHFQVLGSGYGKDLRHVYYHGELLPDVDTFDFIPPPSHNSATMILPVNPIYPPPMSVYIPPPPPTYNPICLHPRISSTHSLSTPAMTLSHSTLNGGYGRRNDTVDCCVLI